MGKEHDGVKTIIEMVLGTRLDCAVGSAALVRQALMQVILSYWSSKKLINRFFFYFEEISTTIMIFSRRIFFHFFLHVRLLGMLVIEKHLVDY